MTKKELVLRLTKQQEHLTPQEINRAVNLLLEEMMIALSEGNRIEIRGFGSFCLRRWGARYARNPATGETWRTKPMHAVHFKPGRVLRDRVNSYNKKNAAEIQPAPYEETSTEE